MRVILATLLTLTRCAPIFALLTENAVAENIVINNPNIQYNYTHQTLGSLNFCDFATVVAKAPFVIKLTAAFVTDDTKPKNENLTVAYMVEAFLVRVGKNNSKLESAPIKVTAGRIISDSFHSDLMTTKNIDKGLGASYTITSEGSLALFTSVVTVRGEYSLAVELENRANLIVNVRPTPKILEASEKWNECGLAIMEHRTPQ